MRSRRVPFGLLLSLAVATSSALAAAPAGVPLHGSLLDADGAPVEAAAVALLPPTPTWNPKALEELPAQPVAKAVSDAEGRFALTAPEDGHWRIVARKDGYLPLEIDLFWPMSQNMLAWPHTMQPATTCALTVTDDAGKAIGGAFVALETGDGPRRHTQSGRSDAGGGWTAPCAGGSGRTWVVIAPGFAPAVLRSAKASVAITLGRGTEFAFRIVDGQQQPLEGVTAFLRESRAPLATADDKGELRLALRDRTELYFLHPRGAAATVLSPAPPKPGQPNPVRVVALLDPPVAAGAVIDRRSRRPLAGALVSLSRDEVVRTDTQGRYRIALPGQVGDAQGSLSAPGYLPSWVKLTPGQPQLFDLRPERRVEALVVGEDGRPLPNVRWTAVPMSYGGSSGMSVAVSDRDGRFTLTGLEAGLGYRARARKQGYGALEIQIPEDIAGRWRVELPRGGSIVGFALDAEGRPVPGAAVAWHREESGGIGRSASDPESMRDRAATGIEGRFLCAGLEPGRYRLEVTAKGFQPARLQGLEVQQGQATDAGSIPLAAGLTVTGTVVDPQSRPLDGVTIHWLDDDQRRVRTSLLLRWQLAMKPAVAVSDAQGRFAVSDRAAGDTLGFYFQRDGFAPLRFDSGPPTEGQEPLRIVMRPTLRVGGRVVDPDRKPVAGAFVEVAAEELLGGYRYYGAMPIEITDQQGEFLLGDVAPGLSTLLVDAAGFPQARLAGLDLAPGQDLLGVEVQLEPGANLSGKVVDSEGTPVSGAEIWPHFGDGHSFNPPQASTDAEGRFRFSGLPVGRLALSASDNERMRHREVDFDLKPGENTVEIRFTDEEGVTVRGIVTDASGQPVAGATLFLAPQTGGGSFQPADSGRDGAFVLKNVREGSHQVMARKEGYVRWRSTEPLVVAKLPIAGYRIELREGGSIAGEIRGLPRAALAQLEISAHSPGRWGRGTITPAGGYRIVGLEPGEYQVEALRTGGGGRAGAQASVTEGQETRADLTFEAGAPLTGTVRLGGEALPGATVEAEGSGHLERAGAQTDPAGRFSLEGLSPGAYRLAVDSPRLSAIHRREITLPKEGLDLLIDVTGSFVAGRVAEAASGKPLSGVSVSLRPEDPGEDSMGWTDDTRATDLRGVFAFRNAPPGAWKIEVRKEGYAAQNLRLRLEPGSNADDLDFRLEAAARLTVIVTGRDSQAPRGVTYAIVHPTGEIVAHGNKALDDGQVVFESVAAGTWDVILSAPGHAAIEARVSMPGPPGQVVLEREAVLEVTLPTLGEDRVAKVRLERADGRRLRVPTWGDLGIRSEFTAYAGRAVISNVPAGEWRVVAETADGVAISETVTVSPGERKTVTIGARQAEE